MITIRRVYDQPASTEHYKVLVDRFWPRGFSKEKAEWNEWNREIAPSKSLCSWFSHDTDKWLEFKSRYREELTARQDELKKLKHLEELHGTLTLLFSARDRDHNNAIVLKEILKEY